MNTVSTVRHALTQLLNAVVLGFRVELGQLPRSVWQGDGAVSEVVEHCTEMLPASVDQDPTCEHRKWAWSLDISLLHKFT